MDMPCCNMLKVMDVLGFTEIPKHLVVKRWARDVRDILPPHLQVYQRDHAGSRTMTHRHTALYVHAMELVRLGDACVESYERGMQIIKDDIVTLAQYEDQRGGLALEDRPSGGGGIAAVANEDVAVGNGAEPQVQEGTLVGLGAPEKKRKAGRPINSRDKAPYEELSRRTRFCSTCRGKGHKRTTCPERGDLPKQPRKEAKCSNCVLAGHRKNTCTNPEGVKLHTAP